MSKQIEKNNWDAKLLDAGDGSGDLILVLPPELVQKVGCNVGDKFEIDCDEKDGRIWFKKK
ncbi:MAG: hypothetical protein C4516_10655 [Oxalobacter sp.]|nr:MAG: hypothetical protein C4516_10655 [Oxalobacter sp.]